MYFLSFGHPFYSLRSTFPPVIDSYEDSAVTVPSYYPELKYNNIAHFLIIPLNRI